MSDLKDALAFYELNGYLQPFQCDLVVERIAKLEAGIDEALKFTSRPDTAHLKLIIRQLRALKNDEVKG